MFLFVGINNKLINKVIKCLCGLNCLFTMDYPIVETFLNSKGHKKILNI